MSGTFGPMGDVGFMGRMDGGREGITLQGQNVERPSSAALEDFWQAFIPDSLVDGNSQAMEDILARDGPTSAALTPTLHTADSALGVSRDNCGVSSYGLSHPSLQPNLSAAVDQSEEGQPRAVGDAGKQASAAVAGDRLRKLQEKNRRAQKRFREKQKARISSMEEQLEELNRKVAQLKTENVRLVSANNMLQQVASLNEQTSVGQGGREGITGSATAEMVQGASGGAYIDLQLGGDIVRWTSAFLKTAPADHVFKMWDRMVLEICTVLAEVDQITGRAPPTEERDPQALLPPGARCLAVSNTGSSSASTPAIQAYASGRDALPVTSEQQNARLQHLEKQLDDLTRGSCKVYWEAMKACPLRLRQLSLSSRYYPKFLLPEENLAFHMRIAQMMELDLDQKWKTGALYLRYRRKMEACTNRRLELFKAAGRAPPDAVLEWKNYESWVSTQMNLNDIHDCLKEENDILLELQLDIFMQVWTPVQSARYFSAGHPYIPDTPMVAHIHSMDVGLATPLSLPQLSTCSKHSDPESLIDGFEASDGNNTWPTPGTSSSGGKS